MGSSRHVGLAFSGPWTSRAARLLSQLRYDSTECCLLCYLGDAVEIGSVRGSFAVRWQGRCLVAWGGAWSRRLVHPLCLVGVPERCNGKEVCNRSIVGRFGACSKKSTWKCLERYNKFSRETLFQHATTAQE